MDTIGRIHRSLTLVVMASLAMSIGFMAPAAATPAPTAVPTVCTTDFSGYYCFYAGPFRNISNGQWVENNCFGNQKQSMPTYMRDNVRSWDHRQSSGVYIFGLNYAGGGVYQLRFTMTGQSYEDNFPDQGQLAPTRSRTTASTTVSAGGGESSRAPRHPSTSEEGMRRALRQLGWASLVCVVLVTAGCSAGEREDGAGEPPLDEAIMALDPADVNPAQVDYPLDPFWPGDDHVHLIGRATSIVALDCMRRFGLDLPVPEPSDARPFPLWDHYGLWDEAAAGTLGYDSPGFGGDGQEFFALVFEAGQEWMPLVTGEVTIFNGVEVPDGGCQGEASRALGPEGGDLAYLVEGLQAQAVDRARQHTAVKNLVNDWSQCLRQAGWEFDDPMDPFHQFQGGDSSEEVAAALADIACKKETGLLQAWVSADVAYQRVLADERSEDLRAVDAWLEELRSNATKIVAGAG